MSLLSPDFITSSKLTLTPPSMTHRHSTIVIYKTALCSFYLPIALTLLLCGFPVENRNESDPDYYKTALDILVLLGEYFQIQDDYPDYSGSGTPEQVGNINTALVHANPTQRAILNAKHVSRSPFTMLAEMRCM